MTKGHTLNYPIHIQVQDRDQIAGYQGLYRLLCRIMEVVWNLKVVMVTQVCEYIKAAEL